MRISRSKIRRIETGEIDRDRLDLGIVVALAALYDLRVRQLDPHADLGIADELRQLTEVGDLVSPCTPDDGPPRPDRHLAAA